VAILITRTTNLTCRKQKLYKDTAQLISGLTTSLIRRISEFFRRCHFLAYVLLLIIALLIRLRKFSGGPHVISITGNRILVNIFHNGVKMLHMHVTKSQL